MNTFDHARFDALLAAHAHPEQGRVDYAGLQRDRAELDAYLDQIGAADLSRLGRAEQKALLINAYNAYTLRIILERYPDLDSIRDLSDPWGEARHRVGGFTLSLDHIEHNLLRPYFKDERIHFAVNCASIGCPPLAARAFGGAELDAQLDEAARRALGSPRYARREDGALRLTKIMDWYGADFTDESYRGAAKTIPAYVAKYAPPELAAWLRAHPEAAVDPLPYDWSLNDVER